MSASVLDREELTATPTAPTQILSAGPAAPGQEAAWEQFTKIPQPTRTDERWRFANVKDLDLGAYTLPLPIDEATREDLLARSRGVETSAGRMVFANDQLLSREVLSDS